MSEDAHSSGLPENWGNPVTHGIHVMATCAKCGANYDAVETMLQCPACAIERARQDFALNKFPLDNERISYYDRKFLQLFHIKVE